MAATGMPLAGSWLGSHLHCMADRVAHLDQPDWTGSGGLDETGPLAVMDGDCALCTVGARLIARLDRRGEFRIATAESDLGRTLLAHHGLSPGDPESWLVLMDGEALTGLDAMIAVGRRTGGAGWLLQPLRLLPRAVRGWLYRRLARNRYALFGRAEMCAVPDPALRARLVKGNR